MARWVLLLFLTISKNFELDLCFQYPRTWHELVCNLRLRQAFVVSCRQQCWYLQHRGARSKVRWKNMQTQAWKWRITRSDSDVNQAVLWFIVRIIYSKTETLKRSAAQLILRKPWFRSHCLCSPSSWWWQSVALTCFVCYSVALMHILISDQCISTTHTVAVLSGVFTVLTFCRIEMIGFSSCS